MIFRYQFLSIDYPRIPFETFHPSSKGTLLNSFSFASFAETREKFWKRLRVRGYPLRFLPPLFRAIRYSDRKGWLRDCSFFMSMGGGGWWDLGGGHEKKKWH